MNQVMVNGSPVPYLFVRGTSLTWRQTINGRNYLRAIPLPKVQSGAVPASVIRDATAWIRKAQRLALQPRHEALDESKARRGIRNVGEVVEVYQALATRWGRPSAPSVRNNIAALRRVASLMAGVDDGSRVLISDLTGAGIGRVVEHYLLSDENEVRARNTAFSMINQARGVFAAKFLRSPEYDRLELPGTIMGFCRGYVCEHRAPPVIPFSQAEVELLRSGVDLRTENPAAYAHWMLGYYCALRLGEVAQVKRSWIREHRVTDQQRAEWMGARETIWVLDMASDPGTRFKSSASAGYIPLADDVAAKLLEISEGREFVVPGRSPTARYDAGRIDYNQWMRVSGWRRQKAHHALRAYRQQVWFAQYGEECRRAWARHAAPGVGRYYVAQLYLSCAPLGLDE